MRGDWSFDSARSARRKLREVLRTEQLAAARKKRYEETKSHRPAAERQNFTLDFFRHQ